MSQLITAQTILDKVNARAAAQESVRKGIVEAGLVVWFESVIENAWGAIARGADDFTSTDGLSSRYIEDWECYLSEVEGYQYDVDALCEVCYLVQTDKVDRIGEMAADLLEKVIDTRKYIERTLETWGEDDRDADWYW